MEGADTITVARNRRTPVFNTLGEVWVNLSDGDDDGDVLVGDIDGDGEEELIVEVERLVESVKVYGNLGNRKREFILSGKLEHALMGDIDGDGAEELINTEGYEVAAYDFRGNRRLVPSWPQYWYPSAACDLDGDGTDELLCAHSELVVGQLTNPIARACYDLHTEGDETRMVLWVAHNPLDAKLAGLEVNAEGYELYDWLKGKRLRTEEELKRWQEAREAIPPWVERMAQLPIYQGLNNDCSREELMIWIGEHSPPRGGYFNSATQEFVEFQFPEANYRFNIFQGDRGEISTPDLDGDGTPEIVVKSNVATNVMVFELSGELSYYEEFGQAVLAMGVATLDGKDHLVLQLENRLITYP